MAKKNFSFEDLDKSLSKIKGFEMGSILEHNTFSEIDHYIGTGNYLFNAQLSGTVFGGIPNCKTVGFSGDPGSGKTFLALNVCREAQKMDYDVIYAETEGAIDRNTAESFGVDTKRIRYQPIKTVLQFRTLVNNVIVKVQAARENGEEPRVLLVLDSVGMLSTEKEIRDAMEGKSAQDMGLKAKELRSLFRTITLDLTGNKIPFIMTNHTGAGGMFAAKKQSGGDGPIYSASTIVFLWKSHLKDAAKTKTGIIVGSNLFKSRSCKAIDIKFHISFANGMNPYVGLEDYISWDACGVEKGNILTTKEYLKLSEKDQAKVFPFRTEEYLALNKKEKKEIDVDEEKVATTTAYFSPKATAQSYVIRSLGKSVKTKYLFTDEIFTLDVLKELDENVIQPTFRLPSPIEDHEELLEMLDNIEDGSEEDKD